MTQIVHVVEGVVREAPVFVLSGCEIEDCYPAGFVAECIITAPDAVAPGWTYDGLRFAPPSAIASTKDDLVLYAAAARYAKEIGGITVGNAEIDTSRESQGMIANAYAFMAAGGGDASTQFKTISGWTKVSADQLKAIALAVGAHVQACFGVEADIDAKITAGTITTTAQIDEAFAVASS